MKKLSLHVPDMHCPSCVMRLESLEDEMKGVKKVSASYHRQMMDVEYDESQVDEEQIIEAVRRKGYQPERA